ncbi:MAG TPA: 4,5-dihydroxyphthalate dehydrogenase [Hydrogenophaga sp.]|jgi:tripartite-type tricarboxylate transporter receptor subunit TctC|uniref:Bug family tripartite tricarboxylate transporter substrate binding protein n=1 Tax=Hydrogenophaga sp. TaxID=1904254 RepID=UPI0008C32D08|nr:tripartite tricarboxylate transporter substrate binding protein [Hydrogenophaga sp.]OGA75367.1 MAG: 4,5-dihydroxyphthalate dehydrogenase [Burkholderiales bacterium GWE1_65_30]OGA93496.1 MAG: 4,5-dihydroxyphthalate dehydrogenase [Burkholderiales bacterium GWF1_66_17]HAX19433.1 4,5-dihydroxyphthalate dehydrogenase [Hydrogenophaga sp.]HBU17750.1 4,5-dihydroxyphthalate dehydrogenase [Hydrogenophaga sp.]
MKRRFLPALALCAIFAPYLSLAQAQDYPNRPVSFIVPYSPGGLPDTVARIVAQKLTERMKQGVVVENKPGGNGVVAHQTLMSRPTDGYSFIVSDGSMLSITPQINKAAKYAVGQDLQAVSLIARSPLFLVAHPKTGIKTLKDFVAQVKKNPGAYTYGSSGIGSTHHLTMEAMKSDLGLFLTHVPFRGSSQSVPALVGGQVDFLFAALPSMLGFMKNGQVTILASNDAKRSALVPDVPSIAEVIPQFDFSVTVGVLARSGTPPELMKRVSEEIAQVVKMPDVMEKLLAAGIEPVGGGADTYRKAIELENSAMSKAGKHARLSAE